MEETPPMSSYEDETDVKLIIIIIIITKYNNNTHICYTPIFNEHELNK